MSISARDREFLPFWELFAKVFGYLGYRSNNFIVGLTNTHPVVYAPDLWSYTLCGQYPGTVPDGATVTVQCTNAYDRGLRFRYVIVQFPLINDTMNFCEIKVFTVGKSICCITTYYFWVSWRNIGQGRHWRLRIWPVWSSCRRRVFKYWFLLFIYPGWTCLHIRRRTWVNFRGHDIFARKICMKK